MQVRLLQSATKCGGEVCRDLDAKNGEMTMASCEGATVKMGSWGGKGKLTLGVGWKREGAGLLGAVSSMVDCQFG